MLEIRWHRQALKTLRRLPRDEARRIVNRIEQYARRPQSLAGSVKTLRGREGYRLRVGDWRVIFTREGEILAILRIGARGKVYKP